MPPKWRGYLKRGVEKWRPAFEAAGLGSEVIRAVLPDEDGWPEDYAAGDIRCSRRDYPLSGGVDAGPFRLSLLFNRQNKQESFNTDA